MNLALIGFMGVGKTTISHVLSSKLGWEEIDVDQWIEETQGCKITQIFSEKGEQAFRDIETEALRILSKEDGKILSCGGGAVLRPQNVELLKENGRILLLTATPETVYERVRYGKNRPVLNGHMDPEYIAMLMEKRRGAYEAAADIRVATDDRTPSRIAEEIIEIIKNHDIKE